MRRLILVFATLASLVAFAPAQAASASEGSFLQLAYTIHTSPTLVCIRHHESDNNPANAPWFDQGYGAINPQSLTAGAYQFMQSTWDTTAAHFGVYILVGQRPSNMNFFVQDMMATLLHYWQGASPWAGSGCP